jgi:hypothetical protein
MTSTTTANIDGESTPDRKRGRIGRAPLWVRVTILTAMVLIGVLVATMITGGTGIGTPSGSGGHTRGDHGGQMQTTDHDGGDHGSNRNRSGTDHSGDPSHGQTGST